MSNIDAIDGDGMVPVKVKLLRETSRMPVRQHPCDIGYDLYADGQYYVRPNETVLVKTGIAIELPFGWEAQIRSRSGLSLKQGVFSVNGIGTIDSGYRGEVGVILSRFGSIGSYVVMPGDAIAQMVIKRVPDVRLIEVKELSESARGTNGYGSTGR